MRAEPQIQPLEPTPLAMQQLQRIERASFSEPWSMAEFDFLASDERSVQVGLWCDEHLAGYAMALIETEDCHLINLAVEMAYRRQGWGKRLVLALLDITAARGGRACHLEVRVSNDAAIQLYTGLGFHQTGIRLRYYSKPTEDACVMQCPLPLQAGRVMDLMENRNG